jgi:hypothetical protein
MDIIIIFIIDLLSLIIKVMLVYSIKEFIVNIYLVGRYNLIATALNLFPELTSS